MSNQRQTGSAASETGAAQQGTKATVGQEQLIPAEGKVIWKLQDFVRRHGIFLALALLIVISALLSPGFLGNRLQSALLREALALVESGVATPRDIDTMTKYSFAMRMPPLGVFEHADMVGVDMVQSVHSYLLAELDQRTTPSPVTTEQLEKGLLGVKSNQGFYEWTPEKVEERKRKRDEAIIRQLGYMDEDVL